MGGGAVPAVRLRGDRGPEGRRGAHGDRSVYDHGFSQSGRPPKIIFPSPTFGPVTESDERKGAFAFGGAAGLGVDIALLPNLFWRAEWEWVQFAPLKGDHIHISTVRTALGLKF